MYRLMCTLQVWLKKALTPGLLKADDVYAAHGCHLNYLPNPALHGIDLYMIHTSGFQIKPVCLHVMLCEWHVTQPIPGPGWGHQWAERCGAEWVPRGSVWAVSAVPAQRRTCNPSAQIHVQRQLPQHMSGGPTSCQQRRTGQEEHWFVQHVEPLSQKRGEKPRLVAESVILACIFLLHSTRYLNSNQHFSHLWNFFCQK